MTSYTYPVTRTPEQGHTRRCLAAAMIAAVENLRDADDRTDVEFRIGLQDGTPLRWADLYLTEGMTECLCPPLPAAEPVAWGDLTWTREAAGHYHAAPADSAVEFRARINRDELGGWLVSTYTHGSILTSRWAGTLAVAKAWAEDAWRNVETAAANPADN